MKGLVKFSVFLGCLIFVMAVLAGSALAASDGVVVSVVTDKDTYTLTGTTDPVVVSLYIENYSDRWLVLTEMDSKLNSYAQFGNISIEGARKYGGALMGTGSAVKGLAFKACNLPAYQNVATSNEVNYFYKKTATGNLTLLGIYIGPHEKKCVARAEVYPREFSGAMSGVYKVTGSIYQGSIWDWLNQVIIPSVNGPGFEAETFIRIK